MAPKTAEAKASAKSMAASARRKRKRQKAGRMRTLAAADSESSSSIQTNVYRQAVRTAKKAVGLFDVSRHLRIESDLAAVEAEQEPAVAPAAVSSSSSSHKQAPATPAAASSSVNELQTSEYWQEMENDGYSFPSTYTVQEVPKIEAHNFAQKQRLAKLIVGTTLEAESGEQRQSPFDTKAAPAVGSAWMDRIGK